MRVWTIKHNEDKLFREYRRETANRMQWGPMKVMRNYGCQRL